MAHAQSCVTAPSGLVSWWRGEQNALDSADSNNGTLQGSAGFISGEVGQAFSFDGTNAYVSVPASTNLNVGLGSGFTLECWIKPTDSSARQPLLNWQAGSGPPWGVHFWLSEGAGSGNGPGCLFMNVADTAGQVHHVTSAAGLVGSNTWQHVAATYDKASGVANLFYNGVVVATVNVGSITPQTSYPLYLGHRPAGSYYPAGYYQGGMDEVSIYSRALSTNEIQAIYNAGSGGKCVPTPPPACVTAPSGLVSWWRGEQNALDTADGNDGTLAGNTTYGMGRVGQGFVFDGNGDRVTVGNPSNLRLQTFTIEAWVKRSSTTVVSYGSSGAAVIFGYGAGGYALTMNSAGQLGLGKLDISGVYSSATIADMNAHHVAVTKTGSVVVLYLDGTAYPVAAYDPTFTFETSPAIGARGDNADNSFLGLVDEVSIYNRALTAAEVQAIYTAGSAGKCVPTPPPTCVTAPAGLVSWWRGETNALDEVDANSGTASSGISYGPGEAGQAFNFDGTNGYVSVPASASLNVGLAGGFTLECWIKPTDSSARQPLLNWQAGSGPPWGVHFWLSEGAGSGNGPGCLFMNVADTAGQVHHVTSAAGLVGSNTWQHVAATYDKASGVANLFYNGVVVATVNVGSITPQTSYPLYLGHRPAGSYYPAGYYQGGMDEVSIYSRALSTNEIQVIYNAGSAGKCVPTPPPVYDVARDFSTNSNPNGTWSYGYSTTLGGTFILHPERGNWNGLDFWRTNIWLGTPAVYYNPAPDTVTNITLALESHQLSFHPGPNGEFCVIRFTAPTNGVFRVVGAFKGVDTVGTTTDVHIRARGIPTLDGLVTGFGPGTGPAFDFTVALGAGEVVDFAVGRGSNNEFSNDSTGISVQILPSNGTPPSCVPAPSGLVSWWRGESNAWDEVGGNDGTLAGNTAYAQGRVGQGFVFDGNGDKVSVGSAVNLRLQTFTIEAWIKRSSTTVVSYGSSGAAVIFGYGAGGYAFTMNSAGALGLSKLNIDGLYSSGAITDTNFHHVAITKTGSTVVFYVDGVAYPVSAYSSTFTFTTSAAIGARGDNVDNSFFGAVDELAVYNRALSTNEIQAIYNAGSAGKVLPPIITAQPQGAIGYWGGTVQFSVGVEGTPPFSYLWYVEGFPIPWGTNATLTLTNLDFSDGGDYWVAVTNLYGGTNSASALLVVNPAGVWLGTHPFLTITGTVGKTFGIEYTTQVSQTNSWTVLTNITLTQPVQEWIDRSVDAVVTQQRYYRVVPIP